MVETYLHGIEIIEVADGVRPIQTVRSSVIGVIGTAPNAEALSASGQQLSVVTITGDRVTQYSATFQDRPAHKTSSATWWNRDEADSETEDSN
jgi:phage tail sheath protein FI